MEFCPHCGKNLNGFYQYCRRCGPKRTWWFTDSEIVEELSLNYQQILIRSDDGDLKPADWLKSYEDGGYHPSNWLRSFEDGRYYPTDWFRSFEDGIYRPRYFRRNDDGEYVKRRRFY